MVYLIGWAASFFSLTVHGLTGYTGRFFLFYLIALLAAVAFLRGNVGTDTANYELMLADFIQGYTWDGLEPGFVALGWLLATLSPSVEIAARSIALVFFALLAVFVARSDHNERFLLLAYLLPAFAYLYSMNVLRVGLASAILLLAIQQLRRRGNMPALRMGLTALLFHYSSAFSLLYIAFSQRPWLRLSTTLGMLFLLAVVAGAFLVADFYMMAKVAAYQAMPAPGALSGLSKIAPVALLVAGVLFGRLPATEKGKLAVLGVLFALVGWGVTQFSYAGLRILDLLSFALPLSILASYSRLGLEFCRSLKLALVVSGILSAAAIYRGFLLAPDEEKSPFLPYEFYGFGLF